MATDLDASFIEQYININTKLKKRFMRKPNIQEATNEFNALAIQCEHSEQPSFAGHALIGAAKCEGTAGNFLGEAEYYLAAARQFMKAEIKLSSLKCYSPAREDLEAAIGCYIQAMNKYPDSSPLHTAILMELANNLVLLNKKHEAMAYYEQAIETLDETSMLKLKCLCNLLSLNIQCGCFDVALENANTICDSQISIPENILMDVQISRILLSLLVEPAENKKTSSLELMLSNLLNDNDGALFDPELKAKLQSIVICCTNLDLESLIQTSAETEHLFTLQQRDLLNSLIRNMESNA